MAELNFIRHAPGRYGAVFSLARGGKMLRRYRVDAQAGGTWQAQSLIDGSPNMAHGGLATKREAIALCNQWAAELRAKAEGRS